MTSSAALPPSRTCISRQIHTEINNLKGEEEKKGRNFIYLRVIYMPEDDATIEVGVQTYMIHHQADGIPIEIMSVTW
jgi:hypothetical protein